MYLMLEYGLTIRIKMFMFELSHHKLEHLKFSFLWAHDVISRDYTIGVSIRYYVKIMREELIISGKD